MSLQDQIARMSNQDRIDAIVNDMSINQIRVAITDQIRIREYAITQRQVDHSNYMIESFTAQLNEKIGN